MISSDRWQENWRVVSPPGAVRVELPRSRAMRDALPSLRHHPVGTPVVLVSSAPGAARRCKAYAAQAGIELEREYLAFPSAKAPAYLVEDAPALVRLFLDTIVVAPPRTSRFMPLDAVLGVLRALHPLRLIRAAAPGRVVVGRLV